MTSQAGARDGKLPLVCSCPWAGARVACEPGDEPRAAGLPQARAGVGSIRRKVVRRRTMMLMMAFFEPEDKQPVHVRTMDSVEG